MHAWIVVAFLLAALGAGIAAIQKAYVFALIAAAIAATLVPTVFELKP